MQVMHHVAPRIWPRQVRKIATAAELLRQRVWVPRETLREYLEASRVRLKPYLRSLPQSEVEKNRRTEIMEAYADNSGYRYAKILPLHTQHQDDPRQSVSPKKAFFLAQGITTPMSLKNADQSLLKSLINSYLGLTEKLDSSGYTAGATRQEWKNPDILNLARHPQFLDEASRYIGDDIKLQSVGIHDISPGQGSFSAMTDNQIPELCLHSDTTLAAGGISRFSMDTPTFDPAAINLWFALTETEGRAPLYFFPETSNWEVPTPRTYLDFYKGSDQFESTVSLLANDGFVKRLLSNHLLCHQYLLDSRSQQELDGLKRMDIHIKPGQFFFMNSHLLHGSGVNHSRDFRLAISIRYSIATLLESTDSIKAPRTLFSEDEQKEFGFAPTERRTPIIQLRGQIHHSGSIPINTSRLLQVLRQQKEASACK